VYFVPVFELSEPYSSVIVVTRLLVGQPGGKVFSLHCHVQSGSGAHPASYPMGTGGSFPGGKVARA